MNKNKKRYTQLPMPDYAFLQGINLHPNKRQEKHLPFYEKEYFAIKDIPHSTAFLYAVDLFNNEYYWEVHEVLESLWIKAGKHSEEAVFLKGIIQLAVALLKIKIGNIYGAERLYDKAITNLQKTKIYFGINTSSLINQVKNCVFNSSKKKPSIILKEQQQSL